MQEEEGIQIGISNKCVDNVQNGDDDVDSSSVLWMEISKFLSQKEKM